MKKQKTIVKESLWHQIALNRRNYILLAPFLLFFILFTVLPVLTAIYYSFTDYDMINPARFIGIENYTRLFLEDDVFLISLKNTMIFAFVTGPICYISAFLFAWLINELKGVSRLVAITVFYSPVLSGQMFTMWAFIFSSDRYGLINGVLMSIGLINEPVYWLTSAETIMPVLIVVQIWMSLGTGFLSFVAGLKGTDRALYEAGSIDGIRNRFQELWYITFPQMAPQLMFGAVMQIVGSFSVGSISAALAGNPSPEYAGHTIILHLSDYGNGRYEMGYASAIAVILFLMMYFSNKAINKLIARVGT